MSNSISRLILAAIIGVSSLGDTGSAFPADPAQLTVIVAGAITYDDGEIQGAGLGRQTGRGPVAQPTGSGDGTDSTGTSQQRSSTGRQPSEGDIYRAERNAALVRMEEFLKLDFEEVINSRRSARQAADPLVEIVKAALPLQRDLENLADVNAEDFQTHFEVLKKALSIANAVSEATDLRKMAFSFLSSTLQSIAFQAGDEETRVSDGLEALYLFDGDGDVIANSLEGGEDLNLQINDTDAAYWERDDSDEVSHLVVDSSSAQISTNGPASRLIDAVESSGELTIEAYIKPLEGDQAGPARIVSLSESTGIRNFTLAQDGDQFDLRLRTTETDDNGLPSMKTGTGSVLSDNLVHVVATYTADKTDPTTGGSVRIYVNGELRANKETSGILSNWDANSFLLLADEKTEDRPWRGEFHLVAIYSRGLTAQEVRQNHLSQFPQPSDDKLKTVQELENLIKELGTESE